MCFTCIWIFWIVYSFVSFSLFSLPLWFLWNSEVKHMWFWIQFCISFISFPFPFVLFVLSSSFVSFLVLSFPFKVFTFSDNPSDNLAITFRCKRNPGEVLDWCIPFDPRKMSSIQKMNRFSSLGHQVVLRLGEPSALLQRCKRFFFWNYEVPS